MGKKSLDEVNCAFTDALATSPEWRRFRTHPEKYPAETKLLLVVTNAVLAGLQCLAEQTADPSNPMHADEIAGLLPLAPAPSAGVYPAGVITRPTKTAGHADRG